MPRFARIGLIALIIAGFAAYAFYQGYPLIRGPVITVSSPFHGQTLTEPAIFVEGHAQNVSFLYLNNTQIFTDLEGRFSEKLILLPGYNIITVRATDKFSRERIVSLDVILKDNE